MRTVFVVSACVFGAFLMTPGAAAAAEARYSDQPAAAEEAPPAEYVPEQFCARRNVQRRGRWLGQRRCADDDDPAGEEAASEGAFGCARYYAYRGHRRVNLQFTYCRPLFSSRAAPS